MSATTQGELDELPWLKATVAHFQERLRYLERKYGKQEPPTDPFDELEKLPWIKAKEEGHSLPKDDAPQWLLDELAESGGKKTIGKHVYRKFADGEKVWRD